MIHADFFVLETCCMWINLQEIKCILIYFFEELVVYLFILYETFCMLIASLCETYTSFFVLAKPVLFVVTYFWLTFVHEI